MSSDSTDCPRLRRVLQLTTYVVKAFRRGDRSVCALLRSLPQYAKLSDEQILADPHFKRATVLRALARQAGHSSWPKYKKYLGSVVAARPAAEATPADCSMTAPGGPVAAVPAPDSDGFSHPVTRPLITGSCAENWWLIAGGDHLSTRDGEIEVLDARQQGAALQALVGGLSWDHYRIGVDVKIEPGRAGPSCLLEFRAVRSGDTASISSAGGLLRLFDREVGRQWNLIGGRGLPPGGWHRYEVLFDEQGVGHFFDGEVILYQPHPDWQRLPRIPHGPLELVFEAGSDTRIHLRNLQIKFLHPTPEQLAELASNARTNVEHRT